MISIASSMIGLGGVAWRGLTDICMTMDARREVALSGVDGS